MKYLNHFIICILLMSSFISIQTGCSSKPMIDTKTEAKFDTPLRMKLNEANQANNDSPVQCLVKLNGAFDEEKKEVFNETGITVLTVLKEIITIEGHPDAIRKIATYHFVHSISLSQTRYLQEKK